MVTVIRPVWSPGLNRKAASCKKPIFLCADNYGAHWGLFMNVWDSGEPVTCHPSYYTQTQAPSRVEKAEQLLEHSVREKVRLGHILEEESAFKVCGIVSVGERLVSPRGALVCKTDFDLQSGQTSNN